MRPHITLCVVSSLPGQKGDLLSLSSTNGSGSSQAASLLLDEAQRESGASSTKSLVGGICVPHSLLPVLPARTAQDGSLADVFVPLDTIKPSEFPEEVCLPKTHTPWKLSDMCILKHHRQITKQQSSNLLRDVRINFYNVETRGRLRTDIFCVTNNDDNNRF